MSRKETRDAVDLALLRKDVDDLKEAKKSWDLLVRDTTIHTLKWLIMIATAGFMFGWNMPENIRKALSEWIAK